MGTPPPVFFDGKNNSLLSCNFLGPRFDFGDGFFAAFGRVFVREYDVHEHGASDHGIHMLAEHLGLLSIADTEAASVLNHMRGNFGTMQQDYAPYQDVVADVERELLFAAQKLIDLGVDEKTICTNGLPRSLRDVPQILYRKNLGA